MRVVRGLEKPVVWKSHQWFGKATSGLEKPPAMEWDGWEWKPNRYGFYGFNCKNKPSVSGTTHSNRKEARKHLQWEWLTGQDHPGSKKSLEKHKAELEKALEKGQCKAGFFGK